MPLSSIFFISFSMTPILLTSSATSLMSVVFVTYASFASFSFFSTAVLFASLPPISSERPFLSSASFSISPVRALYCSSIFLTSRAAIVFSLSPMMSLILFIREVEFSCAAANLSRPSSWSICFFLSAGRSSRKYVSLFCSEYIALEKRS